jgi:hypothetical protein
VGKLLVIFKSSSTDATSPLALKYFISAALAPNKVLFNKCLVCIGNQVTVKVFKPSELDWGVKGMLLRIDTKFTIKIHKVKEYDIIL